MACILSDVVVKSEKTNLSPNSANCSKSMSDDEHGRNGEKYLADQLQSLPRADIPFSVLLHFRENPGFDESSSCNHNTVHTSGRYAGPVVMR